MICREMIEGMGSRTIGIDLSAQPKNTAVCTIDWSADAGRITHLSVGADNQALLDLIEAHEPAKVAIDAPFGWPGPFLTALTEFTNSDRWPHGSDRRPL